MGHTKGKIGVDYDHTHGKSPFTIATGNFKNGSNWQLIGTANAKEDAERIVTCWNEYDDLRNKLAEVALKATGYEIKSEKLQAENEALKQLMRKAAEHLYNCGYAEGTTTHKLMEQMFSTLKK